MKLSLLYPDGIQTKSALNINEPGTGKIGVRTLYHLNLDRIFAQICEDEEPRSVFLKMLSLPCTVPHIISYRQDVLQVLVSEPDFLNEFMNLYGRFLGLKEGHERERQAMMRHIRSSTAGASAQTLKNLLQANALTLKRCLSFVRATADLFAEYRIGGDNCKSAGLKRIAKEAAALSNNATFERLTALCTQFETMGLDAVLDFHMSLGESGQVEFCSMIEHKYLNITDPDAQSKRRWFARRAEETEPGTCVRIHMSEDTTYDKLIAVPLQSLAEQFDVISDQLFERFCYIAEEMPFYQAAVRYIRFMKDKGVTLTYPRVTEDAAMSIRGLRDLALLVDTDDVSKIISNDMGGENARSGMIVFGENNSGKTVFLRSVGIAQLLGQAGLPVPADHARLPVCTQIMTQFSEAEKEFEKGNDAGRFEQEVRELASLIDTLDDGAMILLNETFQTTAYEEGAEGLYHILNYFSERKIRFLLVSHLRQLEGRCSAECIGIFRTHPGYKVYAE